MKKNTHTHTLFLKFTITLVYSLKACTVLPYHNSMNVLRRTDALST